MKFYGFKLFRWYPQPPVIIYSRLSTPNSVEGVGDHVRLWTEYEREDAIPGHVGQNWSTLSMTETA